MTPVHVGADARQIECVLFDFFGTLVDYSPSRTDQGFPETHALLTARGIDIGYAAFLDAWTATFAELDAWSRATEREFSMDTGAMRFIERVAPHLASPTFSCAIRDVYLAEWSNGVRYLPGIERLIAALGDYRLGIVTNTHHAPLVHTHLERMGIAGAFVRVMTSIEHGFPKPRASIFAAALTALGAPQERTLFVGDSYAADYLGATAAGMRALLIDPDAASGAPATDVIASVFEVQPVLDRWR